MAGLDGIQDHSHKFDAHNEVLGWHAALVVRPCSTYYDSTAAVSSWSEKITGSALLVGNVASST